MPDVPPGTYRVQAQIIGYALGEVTGVVVTAGQTTTADFQLTQLAVALQEIVVVGYGTQVRRDVTGSVASVGTDDVHEVPKVNVIEAIKGRVPGVDVVTTGNKPGDGIRVRLRGERSLKASNDPLYVLDGIPMAGGVGDLNPRDIESIEVLKDASATAIYGSRGANGVVLITTRKGRAGATNFTYDSYAGYQAPLRRVRLFNGPEFAQYRREAERARNNYKCAPGVAVCDPAYTEALTNNRLGMAFDSTGAILFKPTPDGQRVNPLSDIQNWTDDRIRTRLFGTLFAGYDLTPALSWRVNFGADLTFSRRGQFRGAQTQQWQGSSSDAAIWESKTVAYTLDNILTFRRNLGTDHRVDATALYSIQQERTERDSMQVTGLPYEHQKFFDLGSGLKPDWLGSGLSAWALQSFMARF